MVQAHWQYSAASIARGVTHFSTILKDVADSQINQKVAKMVAARKFPHINLLQLDDVCNGGKEVSAALKTLWASQIVATRDF